MINQQHFMRENMYEKATVKQTVPNIHSEKKFPVIKIIHDCFFHF